MKNAFLSETFVTFTDVTLYAELTETLQNHDVEVLQLIKCRNYDDVEERLTNFCFELLSFPEEEQVFIAKLYFTSIVTEIVRERIQKQLLHPKLLMQLVELGKQIEKWENISEYILETPSFIEELKYILTNEQTTFVENNYVKNALQLIEQHLTNRSLSVRWIASELQVSTTHLNNLFKLEIGENVSTYIIKRKLKEIKYEMKYTSKSINEIRLQYGFTNKSNFIQHFKKYVGVTPLQYVQSYYEP